MFENEVAINQFQLHYLKKILADIPESQWYEKGAGHQHSPAWIAGHLALVGQFGQKLLGGNVSNTEWLPIFGPGSSGEVSPDPAYEKSAMLPALENAYQQMWTLAADADPEKMQQPHGLEIFANSPIKTLGNAAAVMLTNHFAFHLSQLSSCRRSAGFPALF